VIEAHKSGLATRVVEAYLRRKMRSAFRGLWVRGQLPAAEQGLVVYANHTSWWDGFVAHQLGKLAGWDAYCVMEERNLQRYRFLARIGAFSIQPGKVGASLAALRYARGLLRRPRAAVLVFPEGEIRPFGELPLRLQGGVEVLARSAGVPCLPVAIRYAFFEHEKPDVLLEVGTAEAPAPPEVLRQRLEALVMRLGRVTRLDGFQRLLAGGRGVSERWDRVRGLGGGGTG
jgi:1-acyl-sn-glycerol-3-phosphate acyltransferase